MPKGNAFFLHNEDILTFCEICDFAGYAVNQGIKKIRLTGGEPLVRKEIVEIVSFLSKLEGLEDLSMTTNGLLLEEYARKLAEAGLHRVNISLDTVNPEKFAQLTGGGNLGRVLAGIKAAQEAGFGIIKINCVVDKDEKEPDAVEVAEFARKNKLHVRFIPRMDMAKGTFYGVIGGNGGICSICNRLRLTCDGRIKPCLFSDISFGIRVLGMEEALRRAVEEKPEAGKISTKCHFYNIGG